ncbi:hypothetical protein [Gordonia sp. SL306]|uniref:hypothetical protein n=1 Tax=Gordonia sp. SL306 TaxID=2995145 RepID=UPI00226E2298|nr:hypothetical protein [Gordonia sp. SL306]WAC57086.1 hypothetical protein OVA31_07535 [Gordonia sp. SL306]
MSVLVDQQGAVRTVTVNRPEQHNALDAETIAADAPLAVQFTKRHMYAAVDHDADLRNRMREGLPEILDESARPHRRVAGNRR